MLDFMWANNRPPTKCSWWLLLAYVLKFWLDQIYSFKDSMIIRFSHFGLNLTIHAHFRGFWGIFPKNDITYHPTQRHLLVRKHVVWAIKRENRSSGTTCAQDREKRTGPDRTVKKSQRCYISLSWEETPPNPFAPKFAMWLPCLT